MSKRYASGISFFLLLVAWPTLTHTSYHHVYPPRVQVEVKAGSLEMTPSSAGSSAVVRSHRIRRGDSLSRILTGWGLSPETIEKFARSCRKVFNLRELRKGRLLRGSFDLATDSLLAFEYSIDDQRLLVVARDGDGFSARVESSLLERRIQRFDAVIDSSLYKAAMEAKVPTHLVLQMMEIYSAVLDFNSDLRPGDSFSMLAEVFFDRGNPVKTGHIIAAKISAGGEVHRAYRFQSSYYDESGNPLRRSLMRKPLARYRRISSRFLRSRRHPVTGRRRPHNGIDISARSGTPIYAAGDGKVEFVGRKGGFGRTIKISHGAVYNTLYAHLRRFASGLRKGKLVRQGDVIGYVGQSGLSTAPHLHYEIIKYGRSVDPLRADLPTSAPLASKDRKPFGELVATLAAQLDRVPLLFAIASPFCDKQ